MMPDSAEIFATAQIVDACMRLKIPYRIAPPEMKSLTPIPSTLWGPVVPVRHYGSVDVFLEVLASVPQQGILVIDNQGRLDEACIGDLTVLEIKNAGIQAIVLRGLHRDTQELQQIGLPVFSYGSYPAGPARLDPREPDAFVSASFGDFIVTRSDTAFVDQDGVVFIETAQVHQVVSAAKNIRETERQQAEATMQGTSLREQFQFETYIEKRGQIQDYTFRKHLSVLAKSIEE